MGTLRQTLAAGLAVLALGAAAEPEPGPVRHMLDAEAAAQFRGVGRLNIAGSRFCTATLIAPAVIATAAHCLFHPQTGRRVPLSEMRFVAGLRLGEVAALRQPVRAAVAEGYVFRPEPDLSAIGADLALLALDAPVPEADAEALSPGALDPAAPVSIVSYGRDRAQAPSIADCAIVSGFPGGLAVGCDVTFGVSGAPVLQGEGAQARLVGVVSAMGEATEDRRHVGLAAAAGDRLAPLRAALDAGAGPAPRPRPGG